MNNTFIKKIIIVFFLVVSLVLLFVLFNDIEERKSLTEKYEKAFLDFLTTGQVTEYVNDLDVNEYNEARGLANYNRDISYLINDYIDYVMGIYKDRDELLLYYYRWSKYDNKRFHNKNNKKELYGCGKVVNRNFVASSLSELNYELTENKLIEILESVIYHNGNDRYSGWVLFGDKDSRVNLPGGIVIEYTKPKKIYPKREVYYKSIKILSPIYEFNIFTRKKKYNEIKVRADYIENDENKTVEDKIRFNRFFEYSLTPIYSKIYDYDSSLTSSNLDVYSEADRAESLRFKKEMYKKMNEEQDDFVIPDAVHNACIGNYDIGTFLDDFKEKIKKDGGLLKNYKIKDTKRIYIDNIEVSGKELRELTLDDGNDTKIYCLFKIIYPGETDFFNYSLEDVSDILTYIIPEDKMNLSYEEMYQLAFND